MSAKSIDEGFVSSSTADEVDSPRKRMHLENTARKSWSLMDGKTDTDVLQEMGVSLLEPDDTEPHTEIVNIHKPSLKRKHDIENVNPNINGSPRSRHSPKSPRSKICSPSPGPSRVKSPRSTEKGKPLQPVEQMLETTLLSDYLIDEETPLAQSVSAEYMPAGSGFNPSIGSGSGSGGKKSRAMTPLGLQEELIINRRSTYEVQGADTFSVLSDEMMLSVFRWLPKRSLAHCMLVCKRWYRVACDETLWQRLDLGNKTLSKDALGRILDKKPIIVRLASSEIGSWCPPAPIASRVQYLDLSMSSLDDVSLRSLLCSCPLLRKLSVESLPLDRQACAALGKCKQLETLNLAMVRGLASEGLEDILQGCKGLHSLNISWCNLSECSLVTLSRSLPQQLQRLNVSGAKALTDDLLSAIVTRCPRLLELDVSDCARLCEAALLALLPLSRLEHLALSRCYLLPPQALTQLNSMPALQYLEVWGTLQAASINALRAALPAIQINQFMFSAIARPTVGTRRTSIWGLRTRD